MILTSDIKLQKGLVRWAGYLVLSVLLITALQLLGIFFNIDFLKSPVPNFHPMNRVSGIGFILLATAYSLYLSKSDSRFKHIASNALAVLVLFVSIWRFLSYALRNQVNIKIVLDRESVSTSTAFCAILAAITLLLINSKSSRRIALSHYTAALIFLFAIFSIFVNSYQAQSFKGIFTVPMAFYAAVCFLLLSIAFLFANPDKGLMKELTTPYAGSIMARKLIPAALILPFLYGFFRIYGQLAGFYNTQFGTALATLAITVTCLVFIIYNASLLNKRDLLNEQAKAELKDAHHFLNTILENIPNMIFIKDAEALRFVRFNKAGEKLLGYSRNDLMGKNDYDFFPKDQADFFIQKDREVFDGDEAIDILEEPIDTKYGQRWLHTKKIPIKDIYGKPLFLIGISEDITEKRKADEQLRHLNDELKRKVSESLANEHMFSSLFYKSPVLKAITEIGTAKYIEVNDAFANFVEYNREEMRGKTSVELNILMFPEKRDEVLQKLRKEGFVRDAETQIISRGGNVRWVSTSVDKISINGKDCYLSATVDITERKLAEEKLLKLSHELEEKVMQRTEDLTKSEQRFRKLLENNFETIALYTDKFVPFYRSPSAERITGWSLEERIRDAGGFNNTHPDDLEKVQSAMKEALANPGKNVRATFRTKHKQGHYIWLEGFFSNMLHDEALKGIVSNFRDVTERKLAEEEINKLTGELRQLLEHIQTSREEERKYIAREIHDELGSALTALKIDVSMMQRKLSSPNGNGNGAIREEMASVIKQIDSAIGAVKKISAELRPEILDHLGIIDAVKWRVQQFENITGIPCKVSYLPEVMTLKKELSTTVYRTVQESLTNIARHAKATAVSILIEQDSDKLLIEIKDNGKGIRDEQLKSARSLGLIGMRERIRLLNGTLSIKGNEGRGTTVSVTLPMKEESIS